ncbi:MAG TPA: ABC transporter substrate-binding protein [Erysipelotrichaceae bacterium]|nr:ABC transporter substrate-binding protein [Erysipelotrichaceae bacterium]
MFWKKSEKIIISAAMITLAGCAGGGSKEPEETIDAKEKFGCNVLNVFAPGEYIGEDVIGNFEKKYNAKVNYDTFESNEMMYTKLLGGSSYDVLLPSDYMIEQLLDENLIQKLDLSQIPNASLVDPVVRAMEKEYDPSGEYSQPYFWGTVGLVYDKTVVDENKVKEKGWEILKDTEYKGNLYYYDSQRDGFMIAFKALGYSMNTDKPEEIEAAYQWLKEMNDTMEPAYVTDEVIDAMINGDKAIAIMYSGDAAYVLSENENMAWYEPEQGTNKWVDAMVIPANASCTGLAHAWINEMISEEVQYENSEYVGYTSVNAEVVKKLSSEEGAYFEDPAYTPRTNGAKDEVFHYNPELKRELSDRWNKVKVN